MPFTFQVIGATNQGGTKFPLGQALSADGAVAAGRWNGLAFRWTTATGIVALDTLLASGGSVSLGMSSDGNVIVGDLAAPPQHPRGMFRWTPADGFSRFFHPTEGDIESPILSGDGNVMIVTKPGGADHWIWNAAGEFIPFNPNLPGANYGYARALSFDGSVAVGACEKPADPGAGSKRYALRYGANGQMIELGSLSKQQDAMATAVSDDGSVVVGQAIAANGQFEAFRWTKDGGMQGLGTWPTGPVNQRSSGAVAVSNDGDTVLILSQGNVCIWRAAFGLERLSALLQNGGVDLTGYTVEQGVTAMSRDGKVFLGGGKNPSNGDMLWRATIA